MTGSWCACCGQESIVEHGALARTIRRQWERIRHTMVALVFHPGQLTAEFRDGLRARSISPWRLAFNMVAVFFLLSFVTDFRAANFPKQDASGTLANAISVAAREAKVDEVTFTERVDRRFNGIYTLLVTLSIASSAVLARLTHWRPRERWSVHFVFALHFIAWGFIANLMYYLGMRSFGISVTYDEQLRGVGAVLFALIVLWQYAYVLLAFRRVYADRWISASAKAVAMVVGSLVTGNAVVLLSFWLAIKSLSRMA